MLEKYKGNLVAQLDDLASSPRIYNSNYPIKVILGKSCTYSFVSSSGTNFLDNDKFLTCGRQLEDSYFSTLYNLFITSPPPCTIMFYTKMNCTNTDSGVDILSEGYAVNPNLYYNIDTLGGGFQLIINRWYLIVYTIDQSYNIKCYEICMWDEIDKTDTKPYNSVKDEGHNYTSEATLPYLFLKPFLGWSTEGDQISIKNLRVYNTVLPIEALNDLFYRKNIITNQNKIISNSFGESASSTKLVKSDGTLNVKGELIEADGQKVSINKNGNTYATEFIEF